MVQKTSDKQVTTPNSSATPPKSNRPIKRFIIVAIIVIVVGGLGMLLTGIYVYHWSTPTVRAVTRVIPAPAVSVNNKWRSYNDYLDAVDTLTYSLSQPALLQASGLTQKPTDQELRTMVVERIIKEEIVRQL